MKKFLLSLAVLASVASFSGSTFACGYGGYGYGGYSYGYQPTYVVPAYRVVTPVYPVYPQTKCYGGFGWQ